jgi:hypothetical protein
VTVDDKKNEEPSNYEKANPEATKESDIKQNEEPSNYEKANPEATKESAVPYEMLSISKEGVPSLSKTVITDD